MSKLIIIGFWQLLLIQSLYSQNKIFKGTLLDDSSKLAIPYANVMLEGTSIGTMTNTEGKFRLIIPENYNLGLVRISHIAYSDLLIDLQNYNPDDTCFHLKKRFNQLNVIEVIGVSAKDILKEIIKNIPANYGKDPVIMIGFLRTKKIVNDSLALLAEAVLMNYKSGYYLYSSFNSKKKSESTNIPGFIRGRCFIDTCLINKLPPNDRYAYPLGQYFDDKVECYVGQFIDPSEFNLYVYSANIFIDLSGDQIIKINFDQKVGSKGLLQKGEILVDAESYAIRQIDLSYSPNGNSWFEKYYGRSNDTINGKIGWRRGVPVTNVRYTYCKSDSLWILQSKVVDWKDTYLSYDSTELNYEFQMELVITDYTRDRDQINSFVGDKNLGNKQNWDKIIGKTDNNYWNDFNIIQNGEGK
jgi:hypothetical protein